VITCPTSCGELGICLVTRVPKALAGKTTRGRDYGTDDMAK
jgi:hypothetical protein